MKVMRDDLHVLTGSYVLDAVSDAEREEFERHLQNCLSCRAEVRGLRETAARLAQARAVAPPARMEQQVLAATYRTRQLRPPDAEPAYLSSPLSPIRGSLPGGSGLRGGFGGLWCTQLSQKPESSPEKLHRSHW